MLDKIKDKLNEVIALADTCPEKYQVKCFEVLLNALIASGGLPSEARARGVAERGVAGVRPDFFARQNITEEEWQQVFYFDGAEHSIIVSDLKERTVAKKQVSLALLLGIKGLLDTGVATLEKAQLIELCTQHGVYDSGNFSTHMRNNKGLFVRKGNSWVLTKPGEKKAAEVIKELL